jgi:lipopolysaccharide transport system permease protein
MRDGAGGQEHEVVAAAAHTDVAHDNVARHERELRTDPGSTQRMPAGTAAMPEPALEDQLASTSPAQEAEALSVSDPDPGAGDSRLENAISSPALAPPSSRSNAARYAAASTRRGQIARWREILYMLVLRDLKARSKQAFLGYFWILIQPLLVTGVFSVLVQQVLGRGDLSDVPYPVFLMAGVIPWQFFANSLNESSESLVKNVDLVRQVYFPREILAIYPVFARLIDVVIGCAALAVFLVVWHVPVSGWAVLVPVIVLEEMLFAAALGMLLSAANVGWRDISRGLPLVLFLMMYAVPVLYPPERVPAGLRPLFGLNPIGYLIDAFRTSVIGPHPPDLLGLAVLGLLGLGALVLAQRVFSIFDGVLADVI